MERFFKALNIRKSNVKADYNFIGAESFRTRNPGYDLLDACRDDNFAAIYPNVRSIANDIASLSPYTVDSNGKPVQSAALNALYHPNSRDSSALFLKKIATSVLVHRKTYLLVYSRRNGEAVTGGNITPENITGFNFLQRPAIERRDGKTYYKVDNITYTEDEVIELNVEVDPYDLYGGYSPSEASIKWVTLDDYIADYQRGFFKNGAVPAGQFIITAPTAREFRDVVDMLQSRNAGAGNNNNVTYTHRPIDPENGRPLNSGIEWVPFNQSNSDIGLSEIFEQANKRIDMAFGVPAIIKGLDDAATYANAQVAENAYVKRVVLPIAKILFTQLTHELNRITGGLGVAFAFDYEIPAIADEELVRANVKSTEMNIINSMVERGYSLDSVVDAFNLSNSYKLLKVGNGAAKIVNPKPEVTEDDSATPEVLNAKAELKQDEIKEYEDEFYNEALEYLQNEVNETAETLKDPEVTEEKVGALAAGLFAIGLGALNLSGNRGLERGVNLAKKAGAEPSEAPEEFLADEELQDDYLEYLKSVGDSYAHQVAEDLRNALTEARDAGLTKRETKKLIEEIGISNDYKARRLAVSEINRVEQMGDVEGMKLVDEAMADYKIVKKWVASAGSCEFCQKMNGKTESVDGVFLKHGDVIPSADGKTNFKYEFVDSEVAQLHPHDKCRVEFEVVKR